MVDVKSIFKSFKAMWIKILESSDLVIHSWSQLATFNFQSFFQCDTNLYFNFDDSIEFSELNNLSSFYIDVLSSFNQSWVRVLSKYSSTSTECFRSTRVLVRVL